MTEISAKTRKELNNVTLFGRRRKRQRQGQTEMKTDRSRWVKNLMMVGAEQDIQIIPKQSGRKWKKNRKR